ncbi:MAG: ribulose-phosphate 3-epimerase [Odoribacteraceae bacterium]|jgi:ribulose-phosphate 3-epimerase|nr:ribulose-phosphate 3-epimerase [Odoribacteraceae bacterium]
MKTHTAKISPSLLAADFLRLGEEVEMINRSAADWIHLDVMDGVFVPNISYGLPVVERVKKVARKPLDVHLMIVQPERYAEAFRDAGADILTVHLEASPHLHRTIQQVKNLGMKAGVALNPHSPVALLEEVIAAVDVVLVMSVNPGFGGQSFIEESVNKVAKLKKLIDATGSRALVEVDGGVNLDTGRRLVMAGADVLVAGSFVFNASDPLARVEELKNVIKSRNNTRDTWKQ